MTILHPCPKGEDEIGDTFLLQILGLLRASDDGDR
jgi:hypothetical protein